jgi:hypothetical protein
MKIIIATALVNKENIVMIDLQEEIPDLQEEAVPLWTKEKSFMSAILAAHSLKMNYENVSLALEKSKVSN